MGHWGLVLGLALQGGAAGLPSSSLTCSLIQVQRQPVCLLQTSLSSGQANFALGITSSHP